jgi:hypothetical protein
MNRRAKDQRNEGKRAAKRKRAKTIGGPRLGSRKHGIRARAQGAAVFVGYGLIAEMCVASCSGPSKSTDAARHSHLAGVIAIVALLVPTSGQATER